MIPIEFPEQNCVYAKDQPEYLPLPVHKTPDGMVISCWALTWDKGNGMCLFGFHHRTEFCLFGYRGGIEMYPRRKAIPTVFGGKSERHSAKPDEFYSMVEPLGANRLDIFARRPREGWTVWGNEVEANTNLSGGTPSARKTC